MGTPRVEAGRAENAYRPESPLFKSRRIKEFLNSVQPGQPLGFFDMDQCLWKAGVDGEEIAFEKFGLIGNKLAWKKALGALTEKGGDANDAHLVEGRPINLDHYPRAVTDEIAEHTGLEKGRTMNEEVVYQLGRRVGRHIVEEGLFRPEAMETLRECDKLGIKLAFITATPVDLAEGVYDSVREALGLPEAKVMGTEDEYQQDGSVKQSLFVIGETKTEIVREAKARGGVAVIGVGDKFRTTDAFIYECMLPGEIDNKSPQQGDDNWAAILQTVRGVRIEAQRQAAAEQTQAATNT